MLFAIFLPLVTSLPAHVLGSLEEHPIVALGLVVLVSLVALLATHIFLREVDRAPWGMLFRARRPLRDFALGYALAGMMLLVLFLVMLAAGWIRVDGWGRAIAGGAPRGLLYFLVLAVGFCVQGGTEEVICRGYLMRNISAWRGFVPALIVSSVLFGIGHGVNPGVSWLSLANVAAIGIFLGLLLLRVSLWAAVGMHAAWNFLLGVVASLRVSGMRIPGLLDVRVSGPTLWTGGDFGPEASLAALILFGAGCVVLLALPGLRAAVARLQEQYREPVEPMPQPVLPDRAQGVAYNYIRIPPPGGDATVAPTHPEGEAGSPGSGPDPHDST
jgi:membrane protease YdiL (CAAX protease family)